MKTGILLLTLMVAMATVTMTSSSKILLIPTSHYSHVNFYSVAAKTLKENGHDVTILVYDKLAKRVTKANVTSLAYPLTADADISACVGILLNEAAEIDSNIFYKGYYMYKKFMPAIDNYCNQLLGNEELMQKIKDANFDLAILDNFPFTGCIHFIPYKFDIRYINMGPFVFPWMHGLSSVPFHEPPATLELKTAELTLGERIMAVISAMLMDNVFNFLPIDQYCLKYVPEKPFKSVKELRQKNEMTLVTIEINCFDFPRISAPHYRYIGSLSSSVSEEPLPEEFRKFADDAKDGLIIISFGSMAGLRKSIIKPIRMLLEALGRMKEKAILQFTKADLGDVDIPANILVKEWFPQTDLLAHQNTKLVIAHGGVNGHLEATYFGVPILTFPFHREQARNGARAEAKGHGKLLKWDETNTLEIYQTMREIIDNESYKQNIQKCAAILKDMPSARDQLIFWVNHVIKHGTEHLRPLAADMPFYKFFGLDVIAVLLTASVVISVITCTCCKCCIRKCCRSNSSSKQKQE